jgi:hypothetical protein
MLSKHQFSRAVLFNLTLWVAVAIVMIPAVLEPAMGDGRHAISATALAA